jgi:hypothetical protein
MKSEATHIVQPYYVIALSELAEHVYEFVKTCVLADSGSISIWLV